MLAALENMHALHRAILFSLDLSLNYIKVSGIPSGNKLIKTVRYPYM